MTQTQQVHSRTPSMMRKIANRSDYTASLILRQTKLKPSQQTQLVLMMIVAKKCNISGDFVRIQYGRGDRSGMYIGVTRKGAVATGRIDTMVSFLPLGCIVRIE